MNVYIISYDLHAVGQNYEKVHRIIRSFGSYCHLQQSVWTVETDRSAVQVRDAVRQGLDRNDKIFVARLSGEAAWAGYTDEISDWLKAALERQSVR